jgi:cytoskeletal protein RodZ
VANRDDEPDRGPWFEQPSVIVTAAVVGVLAIVLLVFAIVQTSRHSTAPARTPMTYTSDYPTPSTLRPLSTTTSSFTPTGSSTATLFPPDTPTTETSSTTSGTTTTNIFGTTTRSR